jgi:hypothetical protein
LNYIWNNYNLYAFSHFHEQTAIDKLLLPKITNLNLLNLELSDLDDCIIQENVKIIPYSYHSLSYDTLFIYHAAGDTTTKFERLCDIYNIYNNNKLKILFQYGSFLCMRIDNTDEYTFEILGIKGSEEILIQKHDSIYFINDKPDRSIYFIIEDLTNYSYYKVKVYNNKESFSCYRKFKPS